MPPELQIYQSTGNYSETSYGHLPTTDCAYKINIRPSCTIRRRLLSSEYFRTFVRANAPSRKKVAEGSENRLPDLLKSRNFVRASAT